MVPSLQVVSSPAAALPAAVRGAGRRSGATPGGRCHPAGAASVACRLLPFATPLPQHPYRRRRCSRAATAVRARISPHPPKGSAESSSDEEADQVLGSAGRRPTQAEEEAEALRRLLRDDAAARGTRASQTPLTPPPVMPPGQAGMQQQQQPMRPFRTVPWVPAFTRRRERLVGKVAAFGMAGTILGEVWTGLGPCHQLAMELGLAPGTVARVLALLAVAGLLGGLLPGSPTWDPANQADVRLGRGGKPPTATPGQAAAELKNPRTWRAALPSIAWLGFNARNELLLGRLSMFLFAAELAAEAVTPGHTGLFVALGALCPGGMDLGDAPLLLLGLAFAMLTAALGRKTLGE